MSEQDGAKLVRTFFDNISAHDLSRNDALKGDGYVFEAPGLTGRVDWEEGQQYIQNFVNAFPDLHCRSRSACGRALDGHWHARRAPHVSVRECCPIHPQEGDDPREQHV